MNIDSADVGQLGQTVGRLDIHQCSVNTIVIVVIVDILVLIVGTAIIVNIHHLSGPQLRVYHLVDQVDNLVCIVILLQLGLSGLYLTDSGGRATKLNVEGCQVFRNTYNTIMSLLG